MKHRRNVLDGNAIALVEVGNGHQDHPLWSAYPENPGPKLAYFIEMNVDGGDVPEKSPDDFLVRHAPLGERAVIIARSRSGSGCNADSLGHDGTSVMNRSRSDILKTTSSSR